MSENPFVDLRGKGVVLLKGGHVIDPKNRIDEVRDVAIKNGKILAVEKRIDAAAAEKVIDVSTLIVTPGVVDIHTHLFATTWLPDAWAGEKSVLPDGFSFRSGTTTMVDAGSAGRRTFEIFRTTVIERAKTRVFALVNIASYGMINDMIEQYPEDFDPKATAEMALKHKDVVVGIKSAHYWRPDWTSVQRAMEAGEASGLPVMVDFGYFRKERPYWELVTKVLRPGDISTHCFRGPVPIVRSDGGLYRYLFEARDRGVLFDLGHGGGSFLFRNALPAIRGGFYPDSISTDLHTDSMNAGMMDMPTTMSKCLVMGMSLYDVVAHSTHIPAQMIGHPELGHLSVGAPADITVWGLLEGRFGYKDSHGGRFYGDKRLLCEMTLKGGDVVWDLNARDAVDYEMLGQTYGIREGEFLVPPPEQ